MRNLSHVHLFPSSRDKSDTTAQEGLFGVLATLETLERKPKVYFTLFGEEDPGGLSHSRTAT